MSRWLWLARLRYELTSFAVATLPEHVKGREPWQSFATIRMHVLSGALEAIGAAVLFIVAMVRYVVGFSLDQGLTAVASMPQTDHGTFFGVGALAFLSFCLTPQALGLVLCVAEGLVRTYEPLLTGRMLGMLLVSWPWRAVEHLRARSRRARIALLLGPARPDEVVLPPQARSGQLEIYSVEDKPWSEVQVVEYLDVFYILASKQLLRRGEHHVYRYLLHATEDREVIRGGVMHYAPAGPPPSPAAPDLPRTSPEARTARRTSAPIAADAAPRFVPPDLETFAAARKEPSKKEAPGQTASRGPTNQSG